MFCGENFFEVRRPGEQDEGVAQWLNEAEMLLRFQCHNRRFERPDAGRRMFQSLDVAAVALVDRVALGLLFVAPSVRAR